MSMNSSLPDATLNAQKLSLDGQNVLCPQSNDGPSHGNLRLHDDHPLLLELQSLRAALFRFQNEAHGASVKLQRNALEHTQAQELIQHLRRDNELLTAEVETLRAHPLHSSPDSATSSPSNPNSAYSPKRPRSADLAALSVALPTPPTPHPAESQAQQLTLALRQLSDKLSLTESSLVKLTNDLLSARAEATRARRAEEQAYALAAHARGREEDAKAAQRSLERILRAKEEELRMADRAMSAYAELVRGMEGRRSSASHTPPPYHESSGDEADGTDKEKASSMSPLDSLEEGKRGLSRLFVEMSDEHEHLEVELARLAGQLEDERARAAAEAQGAADERELRAAAEGELARLRADDTTAAKMVSRYMKFSQAAANAQQQALNAATARHARTIDALSTQHATALHALISQHEATLDSLSARHTATIQTLSAQIEALEERHLAEQERAGRLRTALDELGRDVQREAVGRRREVALRIRLVSREERLRERQRRWVWSVEELLRGDENRVSPHAGQVVQELNEHALKRNDFPMRIVEDACEMLSSLDSTADLKYKDGSDDGALARIIVAENAVRQMVEELQAETTRRMELEVALARGESGFADEGGTPLQDSNSLETSQMQNGEQSKGLNTPDGSFVPALAQPSLLKHGSALPELYTSMDDVTLVPEPESIVRHSPAASEKEAIPVLEPSPSSNVPSKSVLTSPSSLPLVTKSSPSPELLVDLVLVPISPAETLAVAGDILSSESKNDDTSPTSNVPSPSTVSPCSPLSIAQPHLRSPQHNLEHFIPASDTTDELKPEESELQANSLGEQEDSRSGSELGGRLRQTSDRQKELLESLSDVAHRYDHLQHAFRDCHLALQDLKGLATLVESTSVDAASASSSHIPRISPHVLETAIARLDDYTEDARVELEIRISDEAVLARGFEMLLAVPGALAHQSSANLHFPSPRSPATPTVDSDEDIVEQIGRFTAGTEHSVQRARETFERKLDDIQHDIAVLKRVVHDPEWGSTLTGQGLEANVSTDSLSPHAVVVRPPSPPLLRSGWASWIRPHSRVSSSSTSTSISTSTFGHVMTTPRLRHSLSATHLTGSSTTSLPSGSGNVASSSSSGSELSPSQAVGEISPFVSLGLRVAMPLYVPTPDTGSTVPDPPFSRTRTLSTMYMLGLGAPSRRPGSAFSRAVSSPLVPRLSPLPGIASPLFSSQLGSARSASGSSVPPIIDGDGSPAMDSDVE